MLSTLLRKSISKIKHQLKLNVAYPEKYQLKNGDSLSPTHFNIVIDEIISEIYSEIKHGVKIGNNRFKVVSYGVDSTSGTDGRRFTETALQNEAKCSKIKHENLNKQKNIKSTQRGYRSQIGHGRKPNSTGNGIQISS
jgi:hypothetical protein